jgi:two-component system chemotaxis response regulator CheB
LPRDFPWPILSLPSINPHYVGSLAARLKSNTLLNAVVAEDGTVPAPGTVYLAADDWGLLVMHGRLRLEPWNGDYNPHCKDALFRSVARDQGSRAVAIILSGTGHDGAEGMKDVRDAGGFTIIEDRSTSLVFGTAAVAVRHNAVCESLPVQEIGPRLVALAAGGQANS